MRKKAVKRKVAAAAVEAAPVAGPKRARRGVKSATPVDGTKPNKRPKSTDALVAQILAEKKEEATYKAIQADALLELGSSARLYADLAALGPTSTATVERFPALITGAAPIVTAYASFAHMRASILKNRVAVLERAVTRVLDPDVLATFTDSERLAVLGSALADDKKDIKDKKTKASAAADSNSSLPEGARLAVSAMFALIAEAYVADPRLALKSLELLQRTLSSLAPGSLRDETSSGYLDDLQAFLLSVVSAPTASVEAGLLSATFAALISLAIARFSKLPLVSLANALVELSTRPGAPSVRLPVTLSAAIEELLAVTAAAASGDDGKATAAAAGAAAAAALPLAQTASLAVPAESDPSQPESGTAIAVAGSTVYVYSPCFGLAALALSAETGALSVAKHRADFHSADPSAPAALGLAGGRLYFAHGALDAVIVLDPQSLEEETPLLGLPSAETVTITQLAFAVVDAVPVLATLYQGRSSFELRELVAELPLLVSELSVTRPVASKAAAAAPAAAPAAGASSAAAGAADSAEHTKIGLMGVTPWDAAGDRSGRWSTSGDFTILAAGPSFSLFATPAGRLHYQGDLSVLGMPLRSSDIAPVPRMDAIVVRGVFIGHKATHVLLLEGDGALSVFGAGPNGQFGLGDVTITKTALPEVIALPGVVSAAGNSTSSAAVTAAGALYTWGTSPLGQPTASAANVELEPKLVAKTDDQRFAAVALGEKHMVVLTDAGVAMAIGASPTGACGEVAASVDKFHKLRGPDKTEAVVKIGAGIAHTVLLTDRGRVFVYGAEAVCGLTDAKKPVVAPAPLGDFGAEGGAVRAVDIAVGGNHTVVVTSTGAVYFFGSIAEDAFLPARDPLLGGLLNEGGDAVMAPFRVLALGGVTGAAAAGARTLLFAGALASGGVDEFCGGAGASSFFTLDRASGTLSAASRDSGSGAIANVTAAVPYALPAAVSARRLRVAYDDSSRKFFALDASTSTVYALTAAPMAAAAASAASPADAALLTALAARASLGGSSVSLADAGSVLFQLVDGFSCETFLARHAVAEAARGDAIAASSASAADPFAALLRGEPMALSYGEPISTGSRFLYAYNGWDISQPAKIVVEVSAPIALLACGTYGGCGEYSVSSSVQDRETGEIVGQGEDVVQIPGQKIEMFSYDSPVPMLPGRKYVVTLVQKPKAAGGSHYYGSSNKPTWSGKDGVTFTVSQFPNNSTGPSQGEIPQFTYCRISVPAVTKAAGPVHVPLALIADRAFDRTGLAAAAAALTSAWGAFAAKPDSELSRDLLISSLRIALRTLESAGAAATTVAATGAPSDAAAVVIALFHSILASPHAGAVLPPVMSLALPVVYKTPAAQLAVFVLLMEAALAAKDLASPSVPALGALIAPLCQAVGCIADLPALLLATPPSTAVEALLASSALPAAAQQLLAALRREAEAARAGSKAAAPQDMIPMLMRSLVSLPAAAQDAVVSLVAAVQSALVLKVIDSAIPKPEVATGPAPIHTCERFVDSGPSWGFGSIDAIGVTASEDILLVGMSLIYGMGSYEGSVEIRVEGSGEMLFEDQAVVYECDAVETAGPMFQFPSPILMEAGTTYSLGNTLRGASGNRGNSGKPEVDTDAGVKFNFSHSQHSQNGTTVDYGQIPVLYFQLRKGKGGAAAAAKKPAVAAAAPAAPAHVEDLFGGGLFGDEPAPAAAPVAAAAAAAAPAAAGAAGAGAAAGSAAGGDAPPEVSEAFKKRIAEAEAARALSLANLIAYVEQALANVEAFRRCPVYSSKLIPALVSDVASLSLPDSATERLIDAVSPAISFLGGVRSSAATAATAAAEAPLPPVEGVFQSSHPYEPSQVRVIEVAMPSSVAWMTIAFDPQCATVAKADTVQVFLDAACSKPVSPPFYGQTGINELERCWPSAPLVLPGSKVFIRMATFSDPPALPNAASRFGFLCRATGFREMTVSDPLARLELELVRFAGSCATRLIEEAAVPLPEAEANTIARGLLKNGLVNESISLLNERQIRFREDFLAGRHDASPGARLAEWLEGFVFVAPDAVVVPDAVIKAAEPKTDAAAAAPAPAAAESAAGDATAAATGAASSTGDAAGSAAGSSDAGKGEAAAAGSAGSAAAAPAPAEDEINRGSFRSVLRTLFAALVTHQGLFDNAMACAVHLKFLPPGATEEQLPPMLRCLRNIWMAVAKDLQPWDAFNYMDGLNATAAAAAPSAGGADAGPAGDAAAAAAAPAAAAAAEPAPPTPKSARRELSEEQIADAVRTKTDAAIAAATARAMKEAEAAGMDPDAAAAMAVAAAADAAEEEAAIAAVAAIERAERAEAARAAGGAAGGAGAGADGAKPDAFTDAANAALPGAEDDFGFAFGLLFAADKDEVKKVVASYGQGSFPCSFKELVAKARLLLDVQHYVSYEEAVTPRASARGEGGAFFEGGADWHGAAAAMDDGTGPMVRSKSDMAGVAVAAGEVPAPAAAPAAAAAAPAATPASDAPAAAAAAAPATPKLSKLLSVVIPPTPVVVPGSAAAGPTTGGATPASATGGATLSPWARVRSALLPKTPSAGGDPEDLINKPSKALLSLLDSELYGSVREFIFKSTHDVDAVRKALASRKASVSKRIKGYAQLQALIKSVSSNTARGEVLWQLCSSLRMSRPAQAEGDDPNAVLAAANHYTDNLEGAGLAETSRLRAVFHDLFGDIARLIESCSDSEVRKIAMHCWDMAFHKEDHLYIQASNVFAILRGRMHTDSTPATAAATAAAGVGSAPAMVGAGKGPAPAADDPEPALEADVPAEPAEPQTLTTSTFAEITDKALITPSSQPGMLQSIIDGDTETFWESSNDASPSLLFEFPAPQFVSSFQMAVSEADRGFEISAFNVCTGPHKDYIAPRKILSAAVPAKHTGWVTVHVNTTARIFRVACATSKAAVRLRQVRIYGAGGEALKLRAPESVDLSEARVALHVFRLLASQVFGGLGRQMSGKHFGLSQNLREHVVGLLFLDSKRGLSKLQTGVFDLVFSELSQVAADRMAFDWKTLLRATAEAPAPAALRYRFDSDAFPFELISMVHALTASDPGVAYVAKHDRLIVTLVSLMVTGTPRVQRQAIAVLKRLLPVIPPARLSALLRGDSSFSEVVRTGGVLVLFMLLMAKSLVASIRRKEKTSGAEPAPKDLAMDTILLRAGAPLWIVGRLDDAEVLEGVVALFRFAKDECPEWGNDIKALLESSVLALNSLQNLEPEAQLKSTALWFALSSLKVIGETPDFVTRINESARVATDAARKERGDVSESLFCDNHEDGVTRAAVHCATCDRSFCGDCDRFLHMSKRSRDHARHAIIDDAAFALDVHEGCARVKLSQLLIVFDLRRGNALLRLERTAASTLRACRFCGQELNASNEPLTAPMSPALENVCRDDMCQERAGRSCTKLLGCGHCCGGIRNERECMPCLRGCGQGTEGVLPLSQDDNDMCMVCWTDPLSLAPSVRLECGHVFHEECISRLLNAKWSGARITFGFLACPCCKKEIAHTGLDAILAPIRAIRDKIREKALQRASYMGMSSAEEVTSPDGQFYGNLEGYAMHRLCYYMCHKCQDPYFGGEYRCEAANEGAGDFNPEELVCGGCSAVGGASSCPKHGQNFLEYKCRYCCSVAIWFCFGTTHFCDPCHNNISTVQSVSASDEAPHCPVGPKCVQLPDGPCPVGLKDHSPPGQEVPLGCGICRNAATF